MGFAKVSLQLFETLKIRVHISCTLARASRDTRDGIILAVTRLLPQHNNYALTSIHQLNRKPVFVHHVLCFVKVAY